jgi:hypothetical protein
MAVTMDRLGTWAELLPFQDVITTKQTSSGQCFFNPAKLRVTAMFEFFSADR